MDEKWYGVKDIFSKKEKKNHQYSKKGSTDRLVEKNYRKKWYGNTTTPTTKLDMNTSKPMVCKHCGYDVFINGKNLEQYQD